MGVNGAGSAAYSAGAFARRSGRSIGPDDEGRSSFARDRDRLIYCDAFRSLAGKSQVVASTETGEFHNRLTHSLKVAQLGRRLAERLRARHVPQSVDHGRASSPDPDLVEFACLAHDLGHPPFGHNGERVLSECVDELVCAALGVNADEGAGVAGPGSVSSSRSAGSVVGKSALEAAAAVSGFEGNPQSFRIVTRLAQKRLGVEETGGDTASELWIGLDLCAASMDAISKYPWSRSRFAAQKWGAYGADVEDGSDIAALRWARKQTGAEIGADASRSFECQLMDWCDDVTYSVHDVDDFYRAGMIPLHLLFGGAAHSGGARGTEPEWEKFRQLVAVRWGSRDGYDHMSESEVHLGIDAVRARLAERATGLAVAGPYADTAQDRRMSQARTSQLIERFVQHVDVRSGGAPMLHLGELALDPSAEVCRQLRDECELLKELLRVYVIESSSLVTQRAGQRRIIRDLVSVCHDDTQLLPAFYRQVIDQNGSGLQDPALARIRTAADYVASLTESQALSLHKRLTGAELGGFRDNF